MVTCKILGLKENTEFKASFITPFLKMGAGQGRDDTQQRTHWCGAHQAATSISKPMATQKEPGEPQGKIRMWERNSRDAAVKVDRDRRDWGEGGGG